MSLTTLAQALSEPFQTVWESCTTTTMLCDIDCRDAVLVSRAVQMYEYCT